MSLADDLLPILPNLRSIASQLGLRKHRVFKVTRTFTGNSFDGSDPIETQEELLEADGYAKVTFLSQKDYLLGAAVDAEVRVGPITPAYPGGGYSPDDLGGTPGTGEEVFLLITGPGMGPNGSRFERIAFVGQRALAYFLDLKRIGDE